MLKVILGICDYAKIVGEILLKERKIGYLEQSIEESNLKKKVYDFLFQDGYDYYHQVNRLCQYLKEVHLSDELFDRELATLLGGEKVKVGILKLLLEDNDILLLDESTRNVSPLSNPVIRRIVNIFLK